MYAVGWVDTHGAEVMMNFFPTKEVAIQYVIDEIRDNYPNFWNEFFEDGDYGNYDDYSEEYDSDEYASRQPTPTPALKTVEIQNLRDQLDRDEKYYFEYGSGEWASLTIGRVP